MLRRRTAESSILETALSDHQYSQLNLAFAAVLCNEEWKFPYFWGTALAPISSAGFTSTQMVSNELESGGGILDATCCNKDILDPFRAGSHFCFAFPWR